MLLYFFLRFFFLSFLKSHLVCSLKEILHGIIFKEINAELYSIRSNGVQIIGKNQSACVFKGPPVGRV